MLFYFCFWKGCGITQFLTAPLNILYRDINELKSKSALSSNTGDYYTIFVTKELLDLKLELIEKDFKALIPDTEKIINRLTEIEEEIDCLQQLIGKNVEEE